MKIQQSFLQIIITFSTCITFGIRSEIPITELSGMSKCMATGYESYAPAVGALYWYSPFVRNLYDFGDQNSEQ